VNFLYDDIVQNTIKYNRRLTYTEQRGVVTTDLYIYNLDTVPHIHVVSNHVDTDKLTTANGERSLELS